MPDSEIQPIPVDLFTTKPVGWRDDFRATSYRDVVPNMYYQRRECSDATTVAKYAADISLVGDPETGDYEATFDQLIIENGVGRGVIVSFSNEVDEGELEETTTAPFLTMDVTVFSGLPEHARDLSQAETLLGFGVSAEGIIDDIDIKPRRRGSEEAGDVAVEKPNDEIADVFRRGHVVDTVTQRVDFRLTLEELIARFGQQNPGDLLDAIQYQRRGDHQAEQQIAPMDTSMLIQAQTTYPASDTWKPEYN